MKVGIVGERRPGEFRVAASPDSVKKLTGLGLEVLIEAGAGTGARMTDAQYAEAGAAVLDTESAVLEAADIVAKVRRPMLAGEGAVDELALMRQGAILIGLLNPLEQPHQISAYQAKGVTAFALELIPRITRAQAMDVLSSQAGVAGYKAVIEATAHFRKIMPMMMTAAGTVAPARVLVLGAGVAGLQAIATSRRMGAIVSAFDVRPVVKEEVESLGAKFIEVAADAGVEAQTAGGYAREMSEDYKRRQSEAIHDAIRKSDIVITTALIPGKPAPRLVTEAMIRDMKPGSVVLDMAVESGGNCALSEAGKVVEKNGVTLIGHINLPAMVATDASALYARNVVNFVALLIDKKTHALAIDWNDDILKASCLTRTSP
ncbi:MAG: Re/Si-specific NAD(P)(+) transhydrogenase subunit alpha [Alphaproteobacteria bacterium]|nr:Re/Si-specific NAD(P)(+) transhydrogenase subunit alpha [Alphaproteobacteria bacterium]